MRRVSALLALLTILSLPAAASRATTYTYTPNPKGEGFFTRTGDAYLPEFTFTNLGLDTPLDIFIDSDDTIYIADTGNARVVVFGVGLNAVEREIRHPDMRYPTGVWLARGVLYVADPNAKSVFCFDPTGALVRTYTRPGELAFGGRDFAPRKVAVDAAGNLFIIGEGLYDGVIQLSPEGQFLGYFTSNKIDLSFVERLQDLFFTDAQKANLLGRSPVTFSNLFVDRRNILYTTTIGENDAAVKKHNAAGLTIVTGPAAVESAAVDLWVSPEGIMVAVFADGETFIYTKDGEIIATFGWSYQEGDVAGLFDTPSAVAMDSRGALWYLDEEKSFLQSYQPTDYISEIFQALALFDQGNYPASIELWREVLKVNQISQVAHVSLGKNYLFLGDYRMAMYHTRIANDRDFFSESFWEIRNIWLQKNVIYIVGLIVLLLILGPVYRLLSRKYPAVARLFAPLRRFTARRNVRAFLFQFRVMRHPSDSFYDLRVGKEGTFAAASTILVAFFAVFLVFVAGKGFIHQRVFVEDIDFTSLVLGYVGLIFLFVLSNYLGTSIHDGLGDMGDIYKMLAYSLAPLGLAMLFVIGLSYVVTLNEIFALNLIMIIGWVWWGVQLLVGLREIHEYSTGGAVASVLFSVVFMVIIVVVGVIITVMTQQVWQFFIAIGKEVIRNVR